MPVDRVRLEVLDAASGIWREVNPTPEAFADPTLRAFERLAAGGERPLRAVADARRQGVVRARRSSGSRRELAQLCGADAKQSRADLQAWLRDADRRLRGVALFVIVAPEGLAAPGELPPKVGLAEANLERLRDAGGAPAIRMTRWPEVLRPGAPWTPERTAEFQRHAYYAMHGLFDRQLFWFVAQAAMDRQRVAASAAQRVAGLATDARPHLPTEKEIHGRKPGRRARTSVRPPADGP